MTFYIQSHTLTASFQVSAHWWQPERKKLKWFESHEYHDIVGAFVFWCFFFLYWVEFFHQRFVLHRGSTAHCCEEKEGDDCLLPCPPKVPELRTFSCYKTAFPLYSLSWCGGKDCQSSPVCYPVAVAHMWSNHDSSLLKSFSVPYLLDSQKTFLISHRFTDGHLSVERTVLRLAGYEESQNGRALGPSFRQSLASDYLTSRSFCIFFVPIVHSVHPRWFISYWQTFPLSLALKITPVHLLGYFLELLGLASQCDVIE